MPRNKRPDVTISCVVCGTKFEVLAREAHKRSCCSPHCVGEKVREMKRENLAGRVFGNLTRMKLDLDEGEFIECCRKVAQFNE